MEIIIIVPIATGLVSNLKNHKKNSVGACLLPPPPFTQKILYRMVGNFWSIFMKKSKESSRINFVVLIFMTAVQLATPTKIT